MKIYSNIVPDSIVRKKQLDTLKIISDSVEKSFGPMGSHTAIAKHVGNSVDIDYTKDGYTIVDNMVFKDTIEESVKHLISDLCLHIVKEVGDGTTSAVILARNIFEQLYYSKDIDMLTVPPTVILDKITEVVEDIKEVIESNAKECTVDDIYDIALISTNNNVEMASIIRNIYDKFGLDVFIDVGISINTENIVKEYDGMTLDTGVTDMCFINDHNKNSCSIRSPKIYAFNDPIDTPEMLNFLDAILERNILNAYRQGSVVEPIPTVILCKALSPDASSYFETICKMLNGPGGDTIPLLIVSDIHQEDLFEDIVHMCGAPLIKKYLNPDIQKEDIDKGLAPTPETIGDFCGSADLVVSDLSKTKIINPSKMFNSNGEYSDEYKSILSFLENELKKAQDAGEGINKIGKLKRRINSFKGNMVDFLIGGVTNTDRNNLKASIEDAVLNCRSAAKYGVGYGANYMALEAISKLCNNDKYKDNIYANIILNSYYELCSKLFMSTSPENRINLVKKNIEHGCPMNIRTKVYDGKVKSSIKSDVIILDTVTKILTLMFTCNQYLVPSPAHNIYISELEDK